MEVEQQKLTVDVDNTIAQCKEAISVSFLSTNRVFILDDWSALGH